MLFSILMASLGALHGGLALGWFVTDLVVSRWLDPRQTFYDDLDYLEKQHTRE